MLAHFTEDTAFIYLSGDSYPSDDRIRLALQQRLNVNLLSQAELPRLYGDAHKNLRLRKKALEVFLDTIPARRVFLFGRSSGARIVTEMAVNRDDDSRIAGIVALGYPFRHPELPNEPERYEHLAHVNTPCLMVQGENDQYGRAATLSRYPLPPLCQVFPLPCDHTMLLQDPMWDALALRVSEFLKNCLTTTLQQAQAPVARSS